MLEQAEPLRVRWISLSGSAAHHAQQRCRALSSQLRKASVTESWAPLQQLDLQIVVEEEQIIASCSLVSLLRVAEVVADDIDEAARVPLSIPTRLRRRGPELRLMFRPPASNPSRRDLPLIGLTVRAHDARRRLAEIDPGTNKAIRRELSRLARLSYLAPDIIAAILDGRQPVDLRARRLIRIGSLPLCGSEQRRVLGFN